MPVIFISYRRSDSQDVADRIYDHLVSQYTNKKVFIDVNNIPLGVSFPLHLQQMLRKASIVLVIIGPRWVHAADQQGQRRLENPKDYVRLEVEAALRANVPVIPVLVFNARLPLASELPASMQKLLERQCVHVRPGPDFRRDIERLLSGINDLNELLKTQGRKSSAGDKEEIPTVTAVDDEHEDGRQPRSKRGPSARAERRKILPSDPPKSPITMCIMSILLVGLGQMMLGQTTKGIIMLLGAIFIGTFTVGVAIPIIWILSGLDAYKIAAKLKEGDPVGEWEFF